MTPLSLAPAGEPMTIVDVRAGRRLRHRLSCLGLVPGAVVEIVQSLGHGPVILAVGDTRLALGRGASHRVLVRPAPNTN
ncbi:MAG: FeoA family protein [Anaerolineae bacterium]|jgi:Fe2+ transport system protein FeoA